VGICTYIDPLRHQATDFLQLVNTQVLAPLLFQNGLLSEDDFERIDLPTMTRGDKANFLYRKLLYLNEEEFKKFLNCLRDAKEHAGHEDLYQKLSKPLK